MRGQYRWTPARLAGLGGAYLLAASLMVGLTRFQGGVACLWIAAAVLAAALRVTPRRKWLAPTLACWAASAIATALFGLGIRFALPFATINVAEAVLAAWLLERWNAGRESPDSLLELGAFVLAAGIAATASGLVAAEVVSLLAPEPSGSNLANWIFGHTLGMLTFMPIAILAFTGELRRSLVRAGLRRNAERAALLLLVAVTTALVFIQRESPVLFLPMVPVILATFRLGQLGAAASLVIIAIVGGGLTARGYGPIHLLAGDPLAHVQLFQLFLATTLLSTLPVAADLRRRQTLYERLRDSEARYRLMTENSTDIVMNLDLDGTMRFVSPSVTEIAGYTPEELIGRRASELIVPEDQERVRAMHATAIAEPGRIFAFEYRALTGDDRQHWFETHTRSVVDEDGSVVGAVSVIRDISGRKQREEDLARKATTDPLTDLVNRRAFTTELDRQLELARTSGSSGCVALFDLDHFKRINDSHGHEAGDKVLQCFARIARAKVREGDLVGRIGGEEFAILLPGATAAQASVVCERVRQALEEERMQVGSVELRVTASVGVARFDGSSERAQVMRAADAALYAAKRTGRNRLELAA